MARTVANAIRIDGLRELQRSMRTLPPSVRRQFNREMRGVANIAVSRIRAQMPEVTGAAKASVKPSLSGGYVAIRAGGSKVPYYPWLDFGGTLHKTGRRRNTQKRPFFSEGRWIYPTIGRNRPAIYAAAMTAVERAKASAGL